MEQDQLEQAEVPVQADKLEQELVEEEWEALKMQVQKVIVNARAVEKK